MKTNIRLIILLVILTAAVITAVVCYLFWDVIYPNKIIDDSVLPKIEQFDMVKEKNYIQLLFVGDLMFDRKIRYFAEKIGSNEFIFDKIKPTLLKNNLVIANLEGPITTAKSMSVTAKVDRPESITFTFDPSLVKTLFNENIRMVSLGNNHILNFGPQGVDETEKYLTEGNIEYFGVPETKRSTIKDFNGIKIAFVSYNYYEFRGDLIKAENGTIDEIKKVKPLADIVVVMPHWGDEYILKNNKAQETLAHKFIDQGADLIIGSHPHVTQNMEIYNSKRIYYSLGNFIFDQYFNENVRNSLGVVVKINKETKQLDFSEEHFYLDTNGQTLPLY
jgi:hypothetical protein